MNHLMCVIKNKFVIFGVVATIAVAVILICVFTIAKNSPEARAEACIASQINEAFADDISSSSSEKVMNETLADTLENSDFTMYKLQDDGSYEEIERKNPNVDLADLLFSKMTYKVIQVEEDNCTVVVTAPDYKKLFCKVYGMNPDTYEFINDRNDLDTDYTVLMIDALEKEDFDYKENTVNVPVIDGVPQVTYELADAFYGNMYSFSYELLTILSEESV